MLRYKNEKINQFIVDMEEAGHEVKHYRGRNFWTGPAITIEERQLQDVIRATDVQLQWDSLGKSGLIVYPISKGGDPIEE